MPTGLTCAAGSANMRYAVAACRIARYYSAEGLCQGRGLHGLRTLPRLLPDGPFRVQRPGEGIQTGDPETGGKGARGTERRGVLLLPVQAMRRARLRLLLPHRSREQGPGYRRGQGGRGQVHGLRNMYHRLPKWRPDTQPRQWRCGEMRSLSRRGCAGLCGQLPQRSAGVGVMTRVVLW